MTTTLRRIGDVPNVPAVYALYGGGGAAAYVAYVGVADRLRARLAQHFLRRDSSVVTAVSAVALVPENVSEIRWWEHPSFADRTCLEAAEAVAFEALEPALRSRSRLRGGARELLEAPGVAARYRELLSGPESGRVVLPTLQSALDRIDELERRLARLEGNG